jgi:hypothetical protein
VTYLDGTVGTKADDLRDIESGAISAEAWDLADLKVRVLDADSAVVTGRGIIKNGKYKGPDGRTQMLKPQYRFTDASRRPVASHNLTGNNYCESSGCGVATTIAEIVCISNFIAVATTLTASGFTARSCGSGAISAESQRHYVKEYLNKGEGKPRPYQKWSGFP